MPHESDMPEASGVVKQIESDRPMPEGEQWFFTEIRLRTRIRAHTPGEAVDRATNRHIIAGVDTSDDPSFEQQYRVADQQFFD